MELTEAFAKDQVFTRHLGVQGGFMALAHATPPLRHELIAS